MNRQYPRDVVVPESATGFQSVCASARKRGRPNTTSALGLNRQQRRRKERLGSPQKYYYGGSTVKDIALAVMRRLRGDKPPISIRGAVRREFIERGLSTNREFEIRHYFIMRGAPLDPDPRIKIVGDEVSRLRKVVRS